MSQTPILHFTHESNLLRIFDQGCLLCDRLCRSYGSSVRSIAYDSIKRKRAQTIVEVPPGGTLDDYVPFYFGPRSPMMYTYRNGNVTGRAEDLSELVYLVSEAEKVASQGMPYAFTDGHPIVEPRSFFNNLDNLGEVDLDLMRERWWYDTNEYPDRKRRRQAEFLVWERMPLELISYFATKTESKRAEVEGLLRSKGLQTPCRAYRNWYYS